MRFPIDVPHPDLGGRRPPALRAATLGVAALLAATVVLAAPLAAYAEEPTGAASDGTPIAEVGAEGAEPVIAEPIADPGAPDGGSDAATPSPVASVEPEAPAGAAPAAPAGPAEPGPAEPAADPTGPEGDDPAPDATGPEPEDAPAQAAHRDAGAGRIATITSSVGPDRAPVANDDHFAMVQDTGLVVDAPGFAANDVDPDGHALTLASLAPWTPGEWAIQSDWSFTYTPPAGFVGTRTYTYVVKANGLVSASATITIEVLPAGSDVDHPPVAHDDAYSYTHDTPLYIAAPGVLGNDVDADGDPLEITLLIPPLQGTLALGEDGAFLYTPLTSDGGGFHWFRYRICDATYCGTAEVRLHKASDGEAPSGPSEPPAGGEPGAGNLPPVAAPDQFEAVAGVAAEFPAPGVLANDVDPEGATLTMTSVIPALHGTIDDWTPDGMVRFTPKPGFTGVTTFAYVLTDGVHSVKAFVDVTVTAPDDDTEPGSPTGPTDPAGPAEPAEPADPTDPAEPIDPADPSNEGAPSRPATVTPARAEPGAGGSPSAVRLAETGVDPRLAVAIASILGALGIVLRASRRRTTT